MVRMLIIGYSFGIRSDWGNSTTATRAVREYLTALDENNPAGTLPKSISPTDPAARLTGAPGGAGFLRLFDQLPDRSRGGDHYRCRSDARTPYGRSGFNPNND